MSNINCSGKIQANELKVNTINVGNIELLDLIYPVGSVYISVNDRSPAEFFGGSWTKLPNNKTFWITTTGVSNTSDSENEISAGLPNIVGKTNGGSVTFGANTSMQGAFTGKSGSTYSSVGSGAGKIYYSKLGFDASVQADGNNPNGIYGNSETVQPPAYKVYAWRRIS